MFRKLIWCTVTQQQNTWNFPLKLRGRRSCKHHFSIFSLLKGYLLLQRGIPSVSIFHPKDVKCFTYAQFLPCSWILSQWDYLPGRCNYSKETSRKYSDEIEGNLQRQWVSARWIQNCCTMRMLWLWRPSDSNAAVVRKTSDAAEYNGPIYQYYMHVVFTQCTEIILNQNTENMAACRVLDLEDFWMQHHYQKQSMYALPPGY